MSRGLVTADFDLDGDLDLVISNCNDLAEVYRNESVRRGQSLQVDLIDRLASNTRAIGAVLALGSGTTIQRREVRAGSSYLSQNSLTQTFGVPPTPDSQAEARPTGDSNVVELLVRWPREGSLRLPGLLPGRRLRVVR